MIRRTHPAIGAVLIATAACSVRGTDIRPVAPTPRAAFESVDTALATTEPGDAWWTTFQDADHEAREAMLRTDDAPKKRRRTRSRGRKKQDDMGADASPPEAPPDE